jgi:hypothetical protein
MSRLSSAVLRPWSGAARRDRAGRRTDRAVARALASAPTVESAHEIAAAAARR